MINLKNNKFKMIFLVIILSVLALSACHSNVVGHQIVGIWEHDGNRIEFCPDGYFKKGNEKYPFSVNEKQVTIDSNGEAMTVDYSINSNGTLTMNGLIYYPVTK